MNLIVVIFINIFSHNTDWWSHTITPMCLNNFTMDIQNMLGCVLSSRVHDAYRISHMFLAQNHKLVLNKYVESVTCCINSSIYLDLILLLQKTVDNVFGMCKKNSLLVKHFYDYLLRYNSVVLSFIISLFWTVKFFYPWIEFSFIFIKLNKLCRKKAEQKPLKNWIMTSKSTIKIN